MIKSRLPLPGTQGGALGATVNGYRVSLGKDENALELDSSDGYTTL
jgi:hypothetical protein